MNTGLAVARKPGVLFLAVTLLVAPSLAHPATAASQADGLWDAIVVSSGVEIPFRFEISTTGTRAQGFFFEGDRKVGSSSGSFENGALKLDYDHLNTTLEAKIDGDQLLGTYKNKRPNSRPMEIRARKFSPAPATTAGAPPIGGTWEMRRVAEEVKAPRDTRTWHLFLRQSGAEVSGSILRVDGDTGYLIGRWRDGKLVLSHFAGERPTLVEAKLKEDGTLSILLNGSDNYFAARSGEARAKGIPEPPDPSRYTSVKNPTEPFHFSFPDLTGKIVADTDPQFRGKVVILAIGGSWCPNCHDEAPFLAELYNEYHARGLEIVGLMFERDEDPATAGPRIRSFIRRYNIQYPMLLAGTTDNINTKLPEIVNFGSYPTSMYLGRDGRVRSVHAGFASPATGEEHGRLKSEIRALVERLLSETRQTSTQR